MSGVAGRIISAVTFSYGASCLCRDPRAMGARLWKPEVVCLNPRSATRCLMNFRWKWRMILRHLRRSLTLLWRQQNFRRQIVLLNFLAELMRQIRWPKLRRAWRMNSIRRPNLKLTRLIFRHCLRQPRRLLRLALHPTLHPTSLVQPLSFLNRLLPHLCPKLLATTCDPLRLLWCSPRCDNRFHKIRCP